MNVCFRLQYRTELGQSIWLKLAIISQTGQREERMVPMRWLNHDQWEISLEIQGVRVEYNYQFRQENPAIQLDEWGEERVLHLDNYEAFLALDTWRSAGTEDYVFATKAIAQTLPKRRPVTESICLGNCEFQLYRSAVPESMAVCILGNAQELGEWDISRPVVMQEIAPNVWRTSVNLSSDARLEYKYGIYHLAEQKVVELELGENRSLAEHCVSENQFTRISDEAYRRTAMSKIRSAGVALPVFSLRSKESMGVGEFADLKPFAAWAKKTGLRLIQILPINDTTSSHTWTDSYPYSAISVLALHPQYLRIDALNFPMGKNFPNRLQTARETLNSLAQIDYEKVMKAKTAFTKKIYHKHQEAILASPRFQEFFAKHKEWVLPYALFCVLRDKYQTADFTKWRKHAIYAPDRLEKYTKGKRWPEMAYHIWLQLELDEQLRDAADDLTKTGIVLKGDLPIGIDRESVDAWSLPHLFQLSAQAGAPPDAFGTVKGQNWGFPTYDWQAMKEDEYAWWRKRLSHLSQYFAAYRIDHILGFFRIWQIPVEQTEGIMGWFEPALPIHRDEFSQREIHLDFDRFCKPYLPEHILADRFGKDVDLIQKTFLKKNKNELWEFKEEFSTQRKIANYYKNLSSSDRSLVHQQALLDLIAEVLFHEVPGSDRSQFHPRWEMRQTRSFQELDHEQQWRVEQLANDYFFQRQEAYWQAQGYEKLPALRRASDMLLCGEDLGVVPGCVPGVMKNLGILSLEIQRMPKLMGRAFSQPVEAPYLSVVSPSTHDMSTLREWWKEEKYAAEFFAKQMLAMDAPPAEMTGGIAARIIEQHLQSPAMWAIFPLQDLLAIDETLRHPHPEEERINVPAIIPFYWRYRMHLDIEKLAQAEELNRKLARLIHDAGR